MYCEFTVYDDDNLDTEDVEDYEQDDCEEENTPKRKHYRYFVNPENKMFKAIRSAYSFVRTSDSKHFILHLGSRGSIIALGDDCNRFNIFDEDDREVVAETWETLPDLLEILEEHFELD